MYISCLSFSKLLKLINVFQQSKKKIAIIFTLFSHSYYFGTWVILIISVSYFATCLWGSAIFKNIFSLLFKFTNFYWSFFKFTDSPVIFSFYLRWSSEFLKFHLLYFSIVEFPFILCYSFYFSAKIYFKKIMMSIFSSWPWATFW